MASNSSVEFFDNQFKQQVVRGDFDLNPFESAVLPYVRGSMLDYGCGLGNLVIHAARQGLHVVALDASMAAIERIEHVAREECLPVQAVLADLRDFHVEGQFDSVVSIGLLMFFDCPTAHRQLERLKCLVKPGGVAAINVLIEGTTFMDMFSPEGHCLFKEGDLAAHFGDWCVQLHHKSEFPAPNNTKKMFITVVARRPE